MKLWMTGIAGIVMLATSLIINHQASDQAVNAETASVQAGSATSDAAFSCLHDCANCQACFVNQQIEQIQRDASSAMTENGFRLEA